MIENCQDQTAIKKKRTQKLQSKVISSKEKIRLKLFLNPKRVIKYKAQTEKATKVPRTKTKPTKSLKHIKSLSSKI